MAKKFKKNGDNRLERTIIRNWIICGVSLVLIIILLFISR